MQDNKEMMPVLMLSYERRKYPDCPREVPMEWLSEEMAQRNHGQTLKRLKERGGLSCAEMWINIHEKDSRQLPSEAEAIKYLNNRLQIQQS